MAPTRRSLIGCIGTLAVAGIAGCTDAFAGESGEPAIVAGDVAEEHDYELVGHEVVPIEEEVDGEDVNTEFAITAYQKDVESRIAEEVTAVYAIVSTPSVTTAGREMNPLVHKSTAEIVEYVEVFEELNIDVKEQIDETQLEHDRLGQAIAVEEHEASVDAGAIVFDGTLISGVIEDEESILLGLGGFSDELDEREAVHNLLVNTETTDSVTVDDVSDRDVATSPGRDAETTRERAGDDRGADATRERDSDEEFPNHVHIRNAAGDQAVALTLTHEGETVYDDVVDVGSRTIETVPDVIDGPGAYRLTVETDIGERNVGFEFQDSTADIGIVLTEDEELVVSDIAARSADRYDDRGQADDDSIEIVVHNRMEADTQVAVTVTPDTGSPVETDLDVPAENARALSPNVEDAETIAVFVATDSSDIETEYSAETDTERVHVTILSDGSLTLRSPDEIEDRERSERESEEDETPDDSVEPANDVIVRSRAESTVEVRLAVSLDGETVLREVVALATGERQVFEGVLTDIGEYDVRGRIEGTRVNETVAIRDDETDLRVSVVTADDLRVDAG